MNTKGGRKRFILVFLPLIFSTLITFFVYSGQFSNYYENYNQILDLTYPDYSFIITGEFLILEPDFDLELFYQRFNLESVTYYAYLDCDTMINSTIYSTKLLWAPSSYYTKYSYLDIENGTFYLDITLSEVLDLELTQNISISFQFESTQTEVELPFGNYFENKDIFSFESFIFSSHSDIYQKYIFVDVETFQNLIEGFIGNTVIHYVPLFEFSDSFLHSYPPHQAVGFLKEKREELDFYFNYVFHASNSKESYIRSNILENKLRSFFDNYREYTFPRIIIFYVICFFFCFFVLNRTIRTYFQSQKEKIIFWYLKGKKRYSMINDCLKSQVIISLFIIIISFILSILLMYIFTPDLISFGYYYNMNFLIILAITIFYSSIQIISQMNLLSRFYQRNQNEEISFLDKIIKISKMLLKWIFIFIVFGASFYLFLFTAIERIEMTGGIFLFIFGILYLVILTFILSEKNIIWLGTILISLLERISILGRFSLKASKRTLRTNTNFIQLILLFCLICNFFLAGSDTIGHYNQINQKYNSIGDISLSYPESSADLVNTNLLNYSVFSTEIQFISIKMHFEIEPHVEKSYGICIFFIDENTSSRIFDSEIFKDKYSGLYDSQDIFSKLYANSSLAVINQALAEISFININETIVLPIFLKDSGEFYSTDLYDVTVVDTFDFAPFFSNIAQERPLVILNKKILVNRDQIAITKRFQIMWVENTTIKNGLLDQVNYLNEKYNAKIHLIDSFSFEILTDSYWIQSVLKRFLIILFITLLLGLAAFFTKYSFEIVDSQVNSFRAFFARGLSIKKGIFYAILPALVITFCSVFIGYLLSIILLLIVIYSSQPQYYLKVTLFLFPYSFVFIISILVLLCSITVFSGWKNYRSIKKHIPLVEPGFPSHFLKEDNI